MKTYEVTIEYPYTRYYRMTVEVEANSADEARLKLREMEREGDLDWDHARPVGDGECGNTEIVDVFEIGDEVTE